jgi:hypothetical protein
MAISKKLPWSLQEDRVHMEATVKSIITMTPPRSMIFLLFAGPCVISHSKISDKAKLGRYNNRLANVARAVWKATAKAGPSVKRYHPAEHRKRRRPSFMYRTRETKPIRTRVPNTISHVATEPPAGSDK